MDASPMGGPGKRKYLPRGPTIPGGIGIKLSRDGSLLKGKVTNLRRQLSKADSSKVPEKNGRGASKKRQEMYETRPNSACFTDASDEKSSDTSNSENAEAIEPLDDAESEAYEIASETIEGSIVIDPAHLPTGESPEVTNCGGSSSKMEAKVKEFPEAPPFPDENISIGTYSKSRSFGKLSLYDLEEEDKIIDSAEHQKGAPSVGLFPEKKLSAEDAFYLSNMTPRHATSPSETLIISCDEYWQPQSIANHPKKENIGTTKPAFDEQSSFESDLGPDCVDSHPSKFYSAGTNSFPQEGSSSHLEPCSGYSAVESIFLNKDTYSQDIRYLPSSNPEKPIPDVGRNEANLEIKSADARPRSDDDIPLSDYDRSVALLKNQEVEVSSQPPAAGIDVPSLKTLAHREDSLNGYSCVSPRNQNGAGTPSDKSMPIAKVAPIKSDENFSGSTGQSIESSKGQVGAVVFWAVAGFVLLMTKALYFASVSTVKLVPVIFQRVIAWRQNQLLTARDRGTSNETYVEPSIIAANETATEVGPDPSGTIRAKMAHFTTETSPSFLVTVARSPRLVYKFVEQKMGWFPKVQTMPTEKSIGEREREGDDDTGQQVSTGSVNIASLQRRYSEPNEESSTAITLTKVLPEQIEEERSSSTAAEIVPLEVSGIVDRKSNSQIEQPTTESDLKAPEKSDLHRIAKKASTSDKIKKIMPGRRSLSFRKVPSKGSFNKSKPDSEEGNAVVLRTPAGNLSDAACSNAASSVGDANFTKLSKKLSKTPKRKSKVNPKLDSPSGNTSDSPSKSPNHMPMDEDSFEKGKHQSKSNVGDVMKKMPKAIMKTLKSIQTKDTGNAKFFSTRSAKKTLSIVYEVCTNDLSLNCSERKGGALRLQVSKELSSSSRIRAKIDIEPTDDFSSTVIFTRDKGDKSTGPQFSALVNEVQQLYLTKVSQGKPSSDSPLAFDMQD